MDEPRRWIDDPDVAPELRDDLRMTAEHQVGFDVEAGLARLEPALASNLAPWLVGIASLAVLVGLGGWLAISTPDEPVDRVSEDVRAEPVVETILPSEAVTPVEANAEIEMVHVVEPDSPARAPNMAPPTRETRPTRPTGSVEDEIAHMARLRAVASRDPRRALALAREGRRLFPDGIFGEEREAIAVLALAALDRADAVPRARRFLRAHPESPFAARIQEVVR